MDTKVFDRVTPDYISTLLPNQIFVFGSNILGYHAGGAAAFAHKKFGAVWGRPEGLQGQCYAIPVDFGMGVRKDTEVKASVEKFIDYAKENEDLHFLVTRVGCGYGGFRDDEMAQFFRKALDVKNICLPKSFIDALEGKNTDYNLERFVTAQDAKICGYTDALNEVKAGCKRKHWIWYIFPIIKGIGRSSMSEYYGITDKEEAKAYLAHPVLGQRLREITQALLNCGNPSAQHIFSGLDASKVKASMTLFDLVSPNDIFNDVLEKFYEGKRSMRTISRLNIREEKNKNVIKTSGLTVTKDCAIYLSDYQKEIKMEPLVKAIYLLFLKHPEGIAFKHLPDYRRELTEIYQRIKPYGLNERSIQSIEDVTNPLLNSINEKCSRVRAALKSEVPSTLLDQYAISGKSGEAKKILLPRDLVIWE